MGGLTGGAQPPVKKVLVEHIHIGIGLLGFIRVY